MKENKIIALTSSNDKNIPSKTLDAQCNVISSYPKNMKFFYFESIYYKDFHAVLKEEIFTNQKSFIVLGELTELGEQLEEYKETGPRRKKGEKITLKDRSSTEMVIDLDDHILEDYNPLKPEPAIITFLNKNKINCNVTWQITSSQKLESNLARLRLYFTLNKPATLQDRKTWTTVALQADGSVFTCSQPIYTAPPIFPKDVKDPIPNRTGYIKGKQQHFILPKITEQQKEAHKTGYSSSFGFEDSNLPEEFLNGTVYRRYLMPLALHYANYLQDAQAIFYIIKGVAAQSRGREFNDENVYKYIEDAIAQVKIERTNNTEVVKEVPTEQQFEQAHFNVEEFINGCATPIPQIWNEFIKIPLNLEENFLFATFMSFLAFRLKGRWRTAMGRRTNLGFLCLGESGGNKDVNSENVFDDLLEQLDNNGLSCKDLEIITEGESKLSGETAFLQSFTADYNNPFTKNLFICNTEFTTMLGQMSSKSVGPVRAMSEKFIQGFDGKKIRGSRLTKENIISGIQSPNFQALLFAQTKQVKKVIDQGMIDGGMLGRMVIMLEKPKTETKKDMRLLGVAHRKDVKIDQEILEFISSPVFEQKRDIKVINLPTRLVDDLDDFNEEYFDLSQSDDSIKIVFRRTPQQFEQAYTVIKGICDIWNEYTGEDENEEKEVMSLKAAKAYWKGVNEGKLYLINNHINQTIDVVREVILEVIGKILNKELKMQTKRNCDLVKKGYVPISQLTKWCLKSNDIKNEGKGRFDRSSASMNINKTIQTLIESQEVNFYEDKNDQLMSKSVKCVYLAR